MNVALFSTKPYDRRFFTAANEKHGHRVEFLEPRLDGTTARLARDFEAVCAFVNDTVDAAAIEMMTSRGTRFLALRCAGYNQVDLEAAERCGLTVVRVPAYSPHAVAEHALALLMTLNRKTHRAHMRIREGNFALDGLLGFDLVDKTVGVVGTGRIGAVFAGIMKALGCRVLAYDVYPNAAVRKIAEYVELPTLLGESDIISLHCPLLPQTHHLIDADAIEQMKPGAMIINTSRGGLIETAALIEGLKAEKVGAVGLDVYEEETALFYEDKSNEIIQDDALARLLTFPNVLVTGHQAFFTVNAMTNIAETTLANLSQLERGEACPNIVSRTA
jgi:D-lactate dehydrogenase